MGGRECKGFRHQRFKKRIAEDCAFETMRDMNRNELPNRRRPAHHAPMEFWNQPTIVLVTVCTQERRTLLACDEVHQLFRTVWESADYWHVGRYVIMPDHVHLFCAPGRIPMPSLQGWVQFWKSQVARHFPLQTLGEATPSVRTDAVNRTRLRLWQRDF